MDRCLYWETDCTPLANFKLTCEMYRDLFWFKTNFGSLKSQCYDSTVIDTKVHFCIQNFKPVCDSVGHISQGPWVRTPPMAGHVLCGLNNSLLRRRTCQLVAKNGLELIIAPMNTFMITGRRYITRIHWTPETAFDKLKQASRLFQFWILVIFSCRNMWTSGNRAKASR